jgi:proteasome assembly chaperone (PAC2) family protein
MENEAYGGLTIHRIPRMESATLVLAFTGWMDGGDVSTGTVERIVELVNAEPFAEIDSESFYIYNFPGSMELSALFRPHIQVDDGLVKSFEMPKNEFYAYEKGNVVFFIGKEPNLKWRAFSHCIFRLAKELGIRRVLFVGSFGGPIPHTREPRLYIICSEERLISEMEKYGVRRTAYEGPGSFSSFLMTQAKSWDIEMTSLVAEIPGYLQGTNPLSIEAVTRRLATILKLSLDLDKLRAESTEWEMGVTSAVEENKELAEQVKQLESDYDDELLAMIDEQLKDDGD